MISVNNLPKLHLKKSSYKWYKIWVINIEIYCTNFLQLFKQDLNKSTRVIATGIFQVCKSDTINSVFLKKKKHIVISARLFLVALLKKIKVKWRSTVCYIFSFAIWFGSDTSFSFNLRAPWMAWEKFPYK